MTICQSRFILYYCKSGKRNFVKLSWHKFCSTLSRYNSQFYGPFILTKFVLEKAKQIRDRPSFNFKQEILNPNLHFYFKNKHCPISGFLFFESFISEEPHFCLFLNLFFKYFPIEIDRLIFGKWGKWVLVDLQKTELISSKSFFKYSNGRILRI